MRNRLVYFLISSACLASTAGADSAPTSPPSFAEVKAQVLERLQKELTCVEAATTFEDMHACRPPPPGGHMGPPPGQQ